RSSWDSIFVTLILVYGVFQLLVLVSATGGTVRFQAERLRVGREPPWGFKFRRSQQSECMQRSQIKSPYVDVGQLNLITFAPPLEIAQYWHERYHRDPGHRWF